MRSLALMVLVTGLCVACGSKGNPAAPPPPTTTTPPPPAVTLQSVSLAATLSQLDRAGATAQVTATGTFSNGSTSDVTSTCGGWASDNPSVLTVSGGGLMTARGSGASTVTTTCQGVFARGLVTLNLIPAQLWVYNGVGDTAFDMPSYVRRLRIRGVWSGRGTSNFVVRIGGRLVVNEILRQQPGGIFDGTYAVTPGLVEITLSSQVAWTLTEVR